MLKPASLMSESSGCQAEINTSFLERPKVQGAMSSLGLGLGILAWSTKPPHWLRGFLLGMALLLLLLPVVVFLVERRGQRKLDNPGATLARRSRGRPRAAVWTVVAIVTAGVIGAVLGDDNTANHLQRSGKHTASTRIPDRYTGAPYYPARDAFGYAPCRHPAETCGSAYGPVFDSFTNVPKVGDERGFLDATVGTRQFAALNTVQPREIIEVRMYVDNDADPQINSSGLGIARQTTLRVAVPSAIDQKALRLRAYISARNATPYEVEDTTDIVSSGTIALEYVPGSATLWRVNGPPVRLSDQIVGPVGLVVGDDGGLTGNWHGGFAFMGEVRLKVRVTAGQSTS
jgi:hypothetical protein